MPSVLIGKRSSHSFEGTTLKTDVVIEKVKMAMLSMQRATWEQGVAM